MEERKIVIPGEVVVEGEDYLPGEGTEKREEGIVSLRFGLAEENNGLIKVIKLSGVYHPRKGNVIIGSVENITYHGWVINISVSDTGFLPLTEVPKYVDKNGLDEVLDIGDSVVAKIGDITKRGIDLTIKQRGLGKIEEGIIVKINPSKVPRVIGKEGSMVKLIKDNTGCNVTVGQNGLIWIKGDTVKDELLTKEAILYVAEKSYISGLTEDLTKWFEDKKGEKNG